MTGWVRIRREEKVVFPLYPHHTPRFEFGVHQHKERKGKTCPFMVFWPPAHRQTKFMLDTGHNEGGLRAEASEGKRKDAARALEGRSPSTFGAHSANLK